MQAIETLKHTDLKVGLIYNREYIGSNEAYKKCNGKQTYEIVSVGEKLEVHELFSSTGDTFDPRLISIVTFPVPGRFTSDEYIVYECPDESKWFIHKVIMPLKEAVYKGVIEIETLKNAFRDQSTYRTRKDPVIYFSNTPKRELQVSANPIAEFPYLTSVVFQFDSTDELIQQVTELFPEAWFMR